MGGGWAAHRDSHALVMRTGQGQGQGGSEFSNEDRGDAVMRRQWWRGRQPLVLLNVFSILINFK
jgi:hypothetical protein